MLLLVFVLIVTIQHKSMPNNDKKDCSLIISSTAYKLNVFISFLMCRDAWHGMAGARSSSSSIRRPGRPERGSLSLNVHEELDQGEENQRVMEAHFNEVCVCVCVCVVCVCVCVCVYVCKYTLQVAMFFT